MAVGTIDLTGVTLKSDDDDTQTKINDLLEFFKDRIGVQAATTKIGDITVPMTINEALKTELDQNRIALLAIVENGKWQTAIQKALEVDGIRLKQQATLALVGGTALYMGASPVLDANPVITRGVDCRNAGPLSYTVATTSQTIPANPNVQNRILWYEGASELVFAVGAGNDAVSVTAFRIKPFVIYNLAGPTWRGQLSFRGVSADGTLFVTDQTP
jgi:hypothetical protein